MVILLILRAAEEGVPQGLKPDFVLVLNVWAEAQTYLEAKTTARTKATADSFASLRNDNKESYGMTTKKAME
jgi:hypothetical protein